MKFFKKKQKENIIEFRPKNEIQNKKVSKLSRLFRKKSKDPKPEIRSEKDDIKYIGQKTNTIMLILLVSGVLISVALSLYSNTLFQGITTEKGSFQASLRQTQDELNRTILELQATKEKLGTATSDVSKIGGLYNETSTDLEQTKGQLGDTQKSLADTQTQLSQTQTTLSSVQVDLNTTKANLADVKSQLSISQAKVDTVCSYMKSNSNLTHSNCP